jgi:hypothetical protein
LHVLSRLVLLVAVLVSVPLAAAHLQADYDDVWGRDQAKRYHQPGVCPSRGVRAAAPCRAPVPRPGGSPAPEGASGMAVDPRSAKSIQVAVGGFAVVSALGGGALGDPRMVADAAGPHLEGLPARLHRLVVGGVAGSLLETGGRRRVDAADLPPAWWTSLTPRRLLCLAADGLGDWTRTTSDRRRSGRGTHEPGAMDPSCPRVTPPGIPDLRPGQARGQ